MKRLASLVIGLLLVLSVAAFGDTIIDPNVGFCAPPATATACSGQPETDPLGATSFGMWSHGANDANTPWYLLVAIPEDPSATAPTITSASFTLTLLGSKTFLPTTTGDIYALVSSFTGGLDGDNSMNAANMFGSLEQAVYGGTPNDFEVFVFQVTPGFDGNTAYSFNTSPLIAGTFVAAVGVGGAHDNVQFSTPFTDAGMVVPEPASLALFGSGLIGLGAFVRRRHFGRS